MLSSYERRVLNEIEVDLARRRARWRAVARACRLPLAASAAGAVIGLSAEKAISAITGTLLALALGVVIGWLLVSIVRGRVVGPRIRRRFRRGSGRDPGVVDPKGC
jgi:hypothetical protein